MGRRDGQDDSSARLSAGRRGPGSVSSSDHHEGADDLLLLGERSFWQTAQEISYQLLFFMIHGNNGDVRVDLLAVILEDAQLLLFLVSRTADVVYAVPGVLSSSFDLRYDSSDLDSFTFPFLVSAIGVFLMVLNVAIVADGVRGQHRFIWAIASLRLLASLTILRIFFSVFYCINGYGAQTCSFTSTPYMIIMSAICLLLYIPMSWAISVNFFDTNPTHKGPTNVVHGRSVSAYALCKILLTATWIVLPNKLTWVKMIVVWLVPMVMFIMINTYFPYYSLAINQIRAGIYASIGSVALIAACASIGNSFYSLDRIPVWLFAVISHSHSKSRDKHEDNVLVFNNWTEVEITARIFTSHLTFRKRYISKPDLEKVYKIFKRGLKEFPDHPQVRLSYATYLYYLNSSQSDFIKQLRRVASSNASYGIRFQVFFLNQTTAQVCNQDKEADQLGSNVKLDVTGYAEFRKIDRLARVNHKQAEECYRTIWVTLMTDRTNAEKIYEQMQLLSFTLNRLVVSTDNCYSSLLAKLYAKFCFDILGDTFKGNALSRRAADLEKEEEGSNRQLNSSANGRRQMGTIEFMDQNESDEEGSFDSLEAGRASEGSQGSQQKPPEDGQGLRRRKIGTRDEDESRSAASHPGTDQAMALLRSKLRMRCETDIQSLRRSAILIGVFVLVLVSSSIGVMCFFLNKTTIYFVNTYWNQQRQHFSALMFRRFRQLQDAYDSNSPTKFGTIQTQLLSEAKYLSYANWFLFQNLNEGEFATVSIKTTNFPGLSIKIPGTATLFDFGQVLSICERCKEGAANNMGTLPFASLSTIKTDNLFNYVLSNFITVTNSATIITWAIVIPTVRAILAVFLIFRFSVVSFRFVEKQKSVFKIFLKIPRKLVKEQQIFWEEAAEQDLLGVGENSGTRLKLQKLSVGGVFVQLSTIVVSMCLIATCAITAYVNVTAVQQVNTNFILLDQASLRCPIRRESQVQ
nr:hypothetical protein HK105_002808 [Polyrhizophydium stewartii]